MALRKITTFPLHKPFEQQDAATSLSEIGLRVVANLFSDSPRVVGSAAMIGGLLAVTARHVVEDLPRTALPNGVAEIGTTLSLLQIVPGPDYVVWEVIDAIEDPVSDIMLLRTSVRPHISNPSIPLNLRRPGVNPFPPMIGDTVAAFGYRHSTIHVSRNIEGGTHIEFNDEPMVSVGLVREIHGTRRDNRLPFPCYQVSARFDAGMSGGPVFDECGNLCGLVCSNIAGSHLDGEPISYVTTLWPLFRILVDFDRGLSIPPGARYPVLELARSGQIHVPDWPRLERWFLEQVSGIQK
jgi:hypothetical protein